MKHAIILLYVLFLACSHWSDYRGYPSRWWREISANKAKSWEVLPQAGQPGKIVVLSKRNELGILSNFAETPFTLDGESYRSVEGFWQMMKYPESKKDPRMKFVGLEWKYSRSQVSQMVSFEAKRAGDLASKNMKKMGINWVSYKEKKMAYRVFEKSEHYHLVRRAMLAKVQQNPEVKKVLLSTGDLELIPDHFQAEDSPPAWKYHKIWMEIRKEISSSLDSN